MRHSRLVASALALAPVTSGCANDPVVHARSSADAGHAGTKKNCRPEYPPAALRTKAQGTSIVRLTLAASGEVTKAEIVQSAGPTPEHRLLDEAAATALFGCPFKPGTDATGRPIGTTVQVSYRWLLEAPGTELPSAKTR